MSPLNASVIDLLKTTNSTENTIIIRRVSNSTYWRVITIIIANHNEDITISMCTSTYDVDAFYVVCACPQMGTNNACLFHRDNQIIFILMASNCIHYHTLYSYNRRPYLNTTTITTTKRIELHPYNRIGHPSHKAAIAFSTSDERISWISYITNI